MILRDPACWVVGDGTIGMEVQSLALAERLGLDPVVKRAPLAAPWRWLPPVAALAVPALAAGLAPPWPRVVIGCGRRAAWMALAVKRATGGRAIALQIQDPRGARSRFDRLIVPMHDDVAGANVIATLGSLTRVTPARLAEAARRFAPLYAGLPRPLVGVLIGGSNKYYRMTKAITRELCARLAGLPAGLAVTASRRTGAQNAAIIAEALAGARAHVWDGSGDSPLLGILALADHLVVTGDSANMLSEAASTGKPVHLVRLDGPASKFDRLHQALIDHGALRPFEGRLDGWRYRPLDETGRVATLIAPLLEAAYIQGPMESQNA